MKNLKDAFIVRPANIEETEYMITIGNHLATEEKQVHIQGHGI